MGGHHSLIYSVPVTSNNPANETEVYRHWKTPHTLISGPSEGDIESLQDMILYAQTYNGEKPCLGKRNKEGIFEFEDYSTCVNKATWVASGMISMGLVPNIKEYKEYDLQLFGIFSKNCVEYLITDMGSALYGLTSVPIYDTLGPQAVSYILDQTNMSTIFVSQANVDVILKFQHLGKLKNVICFDGFKEDQKKKLVDFGLKAIEFTEILEIGKENILEYPDLTGDNVYTFSYTSGTTGNPKGAMISHRNFISLVSCLEYSDVKLHENEVYLSYLPLAHVFERIVICLAIYKSVKIGFYSGDVQKLKYDLEDLKPTAFASVPRLYNKFYDVIQNEIKKLHGFKKTLVDKAVSSKLYYLHSGAYYTHKVYDALVFNKMKQAFGGNVHIMVTGSAPISSEVIDFLKICCSCPILEGYGQTESTGASFLTAMNDPLSGHVGGPLANSEFKLVDVAELGYTCKDKDFSTGEKLPRGEVCIRGPGIFLGYYKDEEKTKEAVDEDGWLHTGDIAQLNLNGSIKIIDRKKNIFKLAQGEYVASEKIETVYQQNHFIEEIFIYGDSLQSFLIAFIFPNAKQLGLWAKEKGIEGDFKMLINNPVVKTMIMEEMNAQAKKAKLFGFEMARKIHLIDTNFQDLELMTTSFKLKRHEAKKYFIKEITEMYKEEGGN